MQHEKKTMLQRTDALLNKILYLAAGINFFLLFFNIRLNSILKHYYTSAAIIIFIVYLIIHESQIKFNYRRLLVRLPDVGILTVVLVLSFPVSLFYFYLLGRQTLVAIRNRSQEYEAHSDHSMIGHLSSNPSGFFLMSFMLTISLGTMLLMLPAATVSHEEMPFIDALFTATSATCVTGLIVVDTGTYFSLFGQLVILGLIQIGALGIMTISGALFVFIGQKMKMQSENLIQNVVGESNKFDMTKLVKSIILLTITLEVIGAALLYWHFSTEFGPSLRVLYISVFHSISAFCNAGFSLFSDSLMQWYNSIPINLIISVLIILGGIGFPVMQELGRLIRKKRSIAHLNFHSKIVLFTTLVLLVLGTVLFFVGEYNNTMKDYSLGERLITSIFQSVTTRTAGFNTIDNAQLSDSSVLSSIFLMFVGASPGSTGGGLKTTAIFVLFATVIAMFKGQRNVTAFHRKISEQYIKRVLALMTASISMMILMVFLLMYFEQASFEKVLFEAFSAFGTVGLSMGITADLTHKGKFVIILLMYLGRVGPLTFGYAIAQNIKKSQFELIEEKINIG